MVKYSILDQQLNVLNDESKLHSHNSSIRDDNGLLQLQMMLIKMPPEFKYPSFLFPSHSMTKKSDERKKEKETHDREKEPE